MLFQIIKLRCLRLAQQPSTAAEDHPPFGRRLPRLGDDLPDVRLEFSAGSTARSRRRQRVLHSRREGSRGYAFLVSAWTHSSYIPATAVDADYPDLLAPRKPTAYDASTISRRTPSPTMRRPSSGLAITETAAAPIHRAPSIGTSVGFVFYGQAARALGSPRRSDSCV